MTVEVQGAVVGCRGQELAANEAEEGEGVDA